MARQSKEQQADAIIKALKVGSQLTDEMIIACDCVHYARFYPQSKRKRVLKQSEKFYNVFRHNIEYDDQTLVVTLIWAG